MNYLALKNLLNTITQTYRCPECGGEIDDSNIDIMGTAGNIANVDLFCSNCDKHSIMRAEVAYIGNQVNKEMLNKIKKELSDKKKISLKDKDIINLNNKLKDDNINITDLFSS